MTPEEQTIDLEELDAKIDEEVARAWDNGWAAGIEAATKQCMADVCEGCREGWPLGGKGASEHNADSFYHFRASRPNIPIVCKASAIRARIEQERDSD